MRVLLAASECAPLVKVGGLGDVLGSLPKALASLGVDVSVVIPYYQPLKEAIKAGRFPEPERVGEMTVLFAGEPRPVVLWQMMLPGAKEEISVDLFANSQYLGQGDVYLSAGAFAQSGEEIERFSFFSAAVAAAVKKGIFSPDVVHCHDYHTSLVPLYLKHDQSNTRPATVLTIHNLFNQGIADLSLLKKLAVGGTDLAALGWDARNLDLDLLMQGIIHADVINTVSPSYAEEIQTPAFGEGLEEIIKSRKARLYGILNGIDYSVWSPDIDSYIYTRFDKESVAVKKSVNKAMLAENLKLEGMDKRPLVTFIGRLVEQKGIDLILQSREQRLLELGAAYVFLGVGDETYERRLLKLAGDNPAKFVVKLAFDEKLAHRLYAAADLILIPSRFEPCGLVQMIAMRYGTIPLARAVGGLKDTIEDGRTGFLFNDYSASALLGTLDRALALYQDKRKWSAMTREAMGENFSWDQSAREYVKLYEKAVSYKELELK
jgi:starch synthase